MQCYSCLKMWLDLRAVSVRALGASPADAARLASAAEQAAQDLADATVLLAAQQAAVRCAMQHICSVQLLDGSIVTAGTAACTTAAACAPQWCAGRGVLGRMPHADFGVAVQGRQPPALVVDNRPDITYCPPAHMWSVGWPTTVGARLQHPMMPGRVVRDSCGVPCSSDS
jgi:hypothetical protein